MTEDLQSVGRMRSSEADADRALGARVDVVIATIGRASLRTALVAGLSQTYPNTRTIVVADGPCPEARAIFDDVVRPGDRALYVELPKRLGDYGDPAKRAWIDDPRAGEWLRFLDDDDWIPQDAIAVMAAQIEPGVSLVIAGMLMVMPGVAAWHLEQRYEVRMPALKPHHAASGMCMLRTDAARASRFPTAEQSDHDLATDVAAQGEVRLVELPLYWYRGHQGGKVRPCPLVGPYEKAWRFKPPRSFRKALLARVSLDNFLLDGEGFVSTYDQALFRPLGRLSRRSAWISVPCYYYDRPAPDQKSVDPGVPVDEAARLMARGYLDGDEMLPYVPPLGGAPSVTWLVPAFRAAPTIRRTVEGIRAQTGNWRCVIGVDGGDRETHSAALLAADSDARFEVRLMPDRIGALNVILDLARTLPADAIVALCDADDYLTRDDVGDMMLAAYTDPDVEVVCGSGKALIFNAWATLDNERLRLGRMLKDPETPTAQRARAQSALAQVLAEMRGEGGEGGDDEAALEAKVRRLDTELAQGVTPARRRRILASRRRVQAALHTVTSARSAAQSGDADRAAGGALAAERARLLRDIKHAREERDRRRLIERLQRVNLCLALAEAQRAGDDARAAEIHAELSGLEDGQ